MEDKAKYYRACSRPALFLFAVMAAVAALTRSWVAAGFGALALVILARYQIALARLKKQGGLEE